MSEARIASTLEHRNIAHVSAVQADGDREFVTIELVEGERLVDLMAAGPIPPERALEIARDVAEALARSHDKGLIHRDLKPANVILSKGRLTKVIDFGVHALQDTVKVSEALAPEQVGGTSVDIRSDIFSFGGMFYAMLTGKPPFTGKDGMAVMSAILQGPAPEFPAADFNVSQETAAILLRILGQSLKLDPKQRYQSMREAGIFLPDAPDDPIRADLLADLRSALIAARRKQVEEEKKPAGGCLSRGAAAVVALLALLGIALS